MRALVFLCPHPHATEQSLNVVFALTQAARVPPSNPPICLFLQTDSFYPSLSLAIPPSLFLPPPSFFLSIASTLSDAPVNQTG